MIIIIIVMTLPGVFAGNPNNRNNTGSGRFGYKLGSFQSQETRDNSTIQISDEEN